MNADIAPSLLLLPKELQLTIWEYVLIEPGPIPFFDVDCTSNPDDTIHRKDRLRWTVPALLQTCRSSRIEGIPIYYSRNTFVIRHDSFLGSYEEVRALFERSWTNLLLVKCFGVEYRLQSGTAFLLQGHRITSKGVYSFQFEFDAALSHQRPLAAWEFWETDVCLCIIEASVQKRRYSALADYTRAMVAFLASFGEKIRNNELRVQRHCRECGKGMLEQKPRSSD
ncbi:hypothetical protein Q7P37_005661 [Cladosporium fusiforme]